MHRPFLLLLLVLGLSVVFAQDPPPVSVPALPDPAIPAPAPAVPRAETRPQPTNGRLVKLEFPNADVRQVLDFYGQLTGKKIVYDNTISGAVNIVVSNPLPAEEAIKIIEINLLLNGFSLVPADQDIVKVLGLSKNPRTTGVPIYSRESQIPTTDQIITYLFKLQYADPTELQQTLAQYIAPSNYTSVVALPKYQALLITESSTVIRGLLKIIAEVDVAPAEVVSEFIGLERADAKDVLEKLEKIFGISNGTSGATQANRPPNTPAPAPGAQPSIVLPGRAPGTLSEDAVISGKITLTADIRTNRIHVITRPVNMPFVRKLVKEFDSNIQFGEPATRSLKYVSAGDVLDVVVKAISEPGTKPEEGTAAANATTNRTRPATTTPALGSRGGYYGGSDGGTQFSEELATEDKDTTPTAVTVGNAKIIADRRANAVIVLGNEEVKQKIFKVLDEIDVRAPQLMLNTVIGELTLTDDETFGVDYLLRYTGDKSSSTGSNGFFSARRSGFAGISRGSNNAILDVASLVNAGAFPTASGLTGFIGVTDSLEIIVRALKATGNFRITNRPMVFTSNNKKAIIASGQEIAVPTNTLTSLNGSALNNQNASVSSSVSFKKVALQLEVVPLINSDREVYMDILQKLDSVVPGADRDVGGSSVPTISTRYIKSTVNVANRSTVALGGLITRNQSDTISGIPVLSEIPGIGALFRTKTKTRKRDELVVLIRPVVTMGPKEDVENSRREQDRLMIEPDLEQSLNPPGPSQKEGVPFRYQK